MTIRTFNAVALGIKHLFHYQPYKAEWLEQILTDSKLYFSNPQNFNDPWDFRPNFASDILDDPLVYERHAQWFEAVSRRHAPDLPEDEHLRRAARIRTDRSFLEGMINDFSNQMARAACDRYRVYCASAKPVNTLMWSHYAASHTGVCLEFDCQSREFGIAIRVEYLDHYPAFDISDNEDDTILLPWLTKSDAWSYEEEFRVIAQEKGTHPPPPSEVLVTHCGVLRFSPRALKSVILGCSIAPAAETHIRSLIQQRIFPPVTLKRAVRQPTRYELSVEVVT